MTPQEVINNIASLKRRGAFDNLDIKALIDKKLKAAKKDKRVSAYKAKVAVEAAGATGELADTLDEVTEAQVKAAGTITRPTALLIDKSGSMNVAIEVGRQLGAMISAICEAELFAMPSIPSLTQSRRKVRHWPIGKKHWQASMPAARLLVA